MFKKYKKETEDILNDPHTSAELKIHILIELERLEKLWLKTVAAEFEN